MYTDERTAYDGLPYPRQTVRHSAGEYVHDMARTNGIEPFWSMLKRGYVGTYHQFSVKHFARYVSEFEGRHNNRPSDQMTAIARGMDGKRLRYSDLVRQQHKRGRDHHLRFSNRCYPLWYSCTQGLLFKQPL